MAWTETQVDMLKTLWAEGLSASQIANQIGGITRNAVIGKIHRLGLAARDKPARQNKNAKSSTTRTATRNQTAKNNRNTNPPDPDQIQTKTVKRNTVANQSDKPAQSSLPQTGTATVQNIRDSMCKWPIGDPGHPDFAFCGRPKSPGSSYCRAHAEIAYQPLRKRDASSPRKPATG